MDQLVIASDYKDIDLVAAAVLKGGFMFTSDFI